MLKLIVVDENNNPVKSALVEVTGLDKKIEETTSSKGILEVNVPIDSEIRVKVSKKDFLDYSSSYFIEENTEKTIVLASQESASYSDKTVFFADKSGASIKNSITVNFKCSNPEAILPQTSFTGITSGKVELKIPNNCGALIADVFAEGYENTNYSLQSGDSIIRLSAINSNLDSVTGTLVVKVIEKETSTPLDGIKLEARNSRGQLIDAGTTTYSGEKYFSLSFDEYTITAIDPNQEHLTETATVSLYSSSDYIEIELSKDYFGKIKITVIDSESNDKIPATITLRKGTKILEQTTTETETETTFLVEEAGTYYARASAEEYISGEEISIEIKSKGTKTEEIELSPCTPEKCSALNVYVIDETGLPVENALVNLNDANTGFIKTGLLQRTTDLNGLAEPVYTLIEPGIYYATATKYPASGESENFEVIEATPMEVIVEFFIGNAAVEVNVTDSYGKAIPFARVEFLNPLGEVLGSNETDEKGYLFKEMKADKEIYLRITKEDFTPYITYVMQLFPDKLTRFNAVLEKEILGDKPEIKFLGLFELNSDYETEFPEPANTYNALFEVSIPSNKSFSETGIHLRTGFSNRIEKDDLFISKINAPNAFILKGKTFDSASEENEEITNGEAKWANIILQDAIPGKYLIQAEIKVKPTFVPETELPIYYRSWGKQGNNYYRDPEDNELGTSLNSEAKKGLYANAYAKIYYETPAEPPCNEEFCFFEKIYDSAEEMFLVEPYSMRIDNDYNYSFTLINNSETLHNNANIRIRNTTDLTKTGEEIEIMNYSLFNADRMEFSSNESSFELPDIELGEFSENKQVTGKLALKPRSEGDSYLEFTVVSDGEIVFTKLVQVFTFFEAEMDLNVMPETVPAFSALIMEINLKERNEDRSPVAGAEIKIKRKSPSGAVTNIFGSTNSAGKTRILIPASRPGTELTITARKPGYAPEEKKLIVTDEVISFNPEKVSEELNWYAQKDSRTDVKITNLTSIPLEISSAVISSESSYPLDALRMQNWITEELIGRELKPGEEENFEFLMILGAEAASMEESVESKGSMVIELTDNSSYWVQELPFNASVSSEQQAREGNCLTVQPITWRQNILGGTAKTNELVLVNNCVNELGEPLPLKNVKATVNWKSNPMGSVLIELNDEYGESSYSLLEFNNHSDVFSTIYEDATVYGSIEFSPLPEFFGQSASFEIEFTAELGGENPPTINGSNPVTAVIDLVDLKKCIYVNENDEGQDGLIEVEADEEETTFTISFSGIGSGDSNSGSSGNADYCSNLEFDVEFCKDDSYCANKVEGGIDVMVGAIPFKANGLKEDTTVTVKRKAIQIPGIYGVTVYARVKGKGAMQKINDLDVIIHPKETYWFSLDKYHFETLLEEGEKEYSDGNNTITVDANRDIIYLTNNRYVETVNLFANYCFWGKDGKLDWWGDIWDDWDCSEHWTSGYVKDYAIDLTTNSSFSVQFQNVNSETSTENIVFSIGDNSENETEIENELAETQPLYSQSIEIHLDNNTFIYEDPIYGILNVNYYDHIHGDKHHAGNAEGVCIHSNNFGEYNLGRTSFSSGDSGQCRARGHGAQGQDTWELKSDSKKFHIRLKTMEPKPELPEQGEFIQCELGIKNGITGIDAVPKVNWNWNWQQVNDEFCDSGNDSINYCDATQLSIEVSKKVNKLYNFLKANSFDLGCPSGYAEEDSEKTYEAETSVIGVTRLATIVDNKNARIEIDLTNNASSAKTVDVNIIRIDNSENIEETILTETVSRGQTKTISKTFTNLIEGEHQILVLIANPEDDLEINSQINQIGFEITDGSSQQGNQETCWLQKTTAFVSGKPAIMHFIEANPNTVWTSDVPNALALRDLLSFNAYLIKDGYSTDFKNDFVDYYTNKSIPPADMYFLSLEGEKGLKDLFTEDKISFATDSGSEQLTSPGIYLINIEAEFTDSWNFFKEGFIETNINVSLHKLLDPTPNNAFYYLPLDGFVGLEEEGFDRTGYGVSFVNTDLENPIQLTTGTTGLWTYPDLGSNPLEMVTVEKVESFEALNSNPGSMGNLFSLREENGGIKMNFAPNVPTPLMLKVSAEETSEPYSIYFRVKESGSLVSNTPNLTYWTGAGRCLDFTGLTIREKFLNSKDRKATQTDERNTSNWNGSYALDWDAVNYPGDVFLYTIFYTVPGKAYQFEADDAVAKSIGGYGKTVNLGAENSVNSVEEILPLIEAEYVCVSQSGSSTSFWWNPKKVLEDGGIWSEANSLDGEKGSCIG
ncbi:MAG: hypothetical protein JW703_01990 [Candidatus Diapherotrites archaeon]|nr:hypothetical protein [Candidatus Diapherotrites archaeon]